MTESQPCPSEPPPRILGKDTAPGTISAPFATLGQAQKAVRKVNRQLASDLTVHVAAGTYYLDKPLTFTSSDSGSNGHRIIWEAETTNGGVNLSGGIRLKGWTLANASMSIWTAKVPKGLRSRHLYVYQKHAQRARQSLDRKALSVGTNGYEISSNSSASFLLTTKGIEAGEIRGINSFTDRYIPIDHVDGSTLVMASPAFQNNIMGWDTIKQPFADKGFYVENVLAFLDEDREYFLDSNAGKIYYKPDAGTKPTHPSALSRSKDSTICTPPGTYRLRTSVTPTNKHGGFIGLNKTYSEFEASRPFWYQVHGSVQVSAASDIKFTNGSMAAIMGGFGIGNDANAHVSGVGLGTSNIEISGMYFTQTGANSITVGGIMADAHHPSDPRMLNQKILVTENILKDTAQTITSAAGILVTYTTGTEVSSNDLSTLPYSGIAWGYGWGTNDKGGVPEYQTRGLYNYQPVYDTPTVMKQGLIAQNLIHDFGRMHTDLAGIYTLSASPDTYITGNCIFTDTDQSSGTGWFFSIAPDALFLVALRFFFLFFDTPIHSKYVSGNLLLTFLCVAYYNDEGSRDYQIQNSVVNVKGNGYGGGSGGGYWWQPNERDNYTTGNITVSNVAVASPGPLHSLEDLQAPYDDILQQAGIPPSQRSARPVSFTYPPSSSLAV
ncbi:pectin lyase [Fusarium subglutinans]|uniref:Pectin lyase n=1 Tax=Gibberella subglutinans TaxID=42677 RepID=A0A8H5UZI7_GIBSU|nr:pectin lyase [Fusarium subglutinans]KAF5603933.1 pectin lyase [Fusarium subglutinans]